MAILVTGGAGFIGSHTVVELVDSGYDVIVVDNFINSSPEVIENIERITRKKISVYNMDLLNFDGLKNIFNTHDITAVMHFAALKSVSESILEPLNYYKNNLTGCLNILELMSVFSVSNFIFSSSATVYGNLNASPVSEKSLVGGVTNPYGYSKLYTEQVLEDIFKANEKLNIISLRYFNPTGAHPSGLIGESPKNTPSNLIPYLTRVAAGILPKLYIYGHDYPTNDGTGVRDFIHVTDLAKGHLSALEYIKEKDGCHGVYNLGTGKGYSVLDAIKCLEKIIGRTIPVEFVSRRDGDVAECWADPSLAEIELKWKATLTLEDMLRDAWNWQKKSTISY